MRNNLTALVESLPMKFSYTILYVKNVTESIAFYEKAFGLKQRFIHESGQYAEMDTGTISLAFASNELAHSNLPQGFQENTTAKLPAGIEIGFVTDDVAVAFSQAVEAGAIPFVNPNVKPWGQTVAYVRDLDGILIELCSPM
ncbi:MAG: VOC family protein [Rhizonema sp. PD37]|nr:VOC family protein [Rhizonema sp. PD37]